MKARRLFLPALLAAVIAASTAGCTRFSASPPEGFAEVKRQGMNRYLAVSPEGLLYGVRMVKNYPRKEINFWQTAVENYMKESGYTLIGGPDSFTTGDDEGVLFTWGAPWRGEDYLYTVGIVPSSRKIVIVETAGPFEVYKKYSGELEDTIMNIKIR